MSSWETRPRKSSLWRSSVFICCAAAWKVAPEPSLSRPQLAQLQAAGHRRRDGTERLGGGRSLHREQAQDSGADRTSTKSDRDAGQLPPERETPPVVTASPGKTFIQPVGSNPLVGSAAGSLDDQDVASGVGQRDEGGIGPWADNVDQTQVTLEESPNPRAAGSAARPTTLPRSAPRLRCSRRIPSRAWASGLVQRGARERCQGGAEWGVRP